MKEIFEIVKKEIPRFLVMCNDIMFSPVKTLSTISYKCTESNKEQEITKAIIYHFFSAIVVTVFFVLQLNGIDNTFSFRSNLTMILEGILIVTGSPIVLGISWKILSVKVNLPFFKYLILITYQISTVLIIFTLFLLIGFSLLRFDSAEHFNLVVADFQSDRENSHDLIFNDPFVTLCYSIILIGMIFSVIWFFVSWKVYRIVHMSSRFKSIIASLIFSLLFSLLMVIILGFERSIN